MASCGLVRWPTHGQGASRELISSCRSAGVVSKQHHGPHHCCGRRRSNAEFESLCSRFVEHASTCTTQPLRSMVSATSMRKRRRGALREAPGSDSVRVPRAAHSSPVKLSIAYNRLQGLRTPTTTPRRRPPSYFCAGPFFDAVSPARQEAPWPLRSLLLLPQCMVEAGPALRTSASAELAAQLGRDDCTFEGVCIRLQKTARWAAC